MACLYQDLYLYIYVYIYIYIYVRMLVHTCELTWECNAHAGQYTLLSSPSFAKLLVPVALHIVEAIRSYIPLRSAVDSCL